MSGAIDLHGVAPKTPLEQVAAEGGGQPGEVANGSGVGIPDHIAGRLQARYEQVLSESVKEFPVPGWSGDLVARVHVIEDRDDYVKAARATDSDAAFIARATSQLLMSDDDGDLIELADARGPIGFDDRFAALLGVEAKSASECVLATLARNPAAVTRFAERLMEWMQREEQNAGAQLPS